MLEIDLPRLRMSRIFLRDLSRAVSRFSRGPVARNHRRRFFDLRPILMRLDLQSVEIGLTVKLGMIWYMIWLLIVPWLKKSK